MGKKRRRGPGRPRKLNNALGRWIDAQGLHRAAAAKRLGISLPHLNRLCRNVRRPDLALAVKIERLTGGAVPAESWLRVPRHSSD